MATVKFDCSEIIKLKSSVQYRTWLWMIRDLLKQPGKKGYVNNQVSQRNYALEEDDKLTAVILSTVDVSIAMKIEEPEEGSHESTLTYKCLNEIEKLVNTGTKSNKICIIQQLLNMKETSQKTLIEKIRNIQSQINLLDIKIEEILTIVLYNALSSDKKKNIDTYYMIIQI